MLFYQLWLYLGFAFGLPASLPWIGTSQGTMTMSCLFTSWVYRLSPHHHSRMPATIDSNLVSGALGPVYTNVSWHRLGLLSGLVPSPSILSPQSPDDKAIDKEGWRRRFRFGSIGFVSIASNLRAMASNLLAFSEPLRSFDIHWLCHQQSGIDFIEPLGWDPFIALWTFAARFSRMPSTSDLAASLNSAK